MAELKHFHLFEFTDQAWYPQAFRRMQTDYLQFVVTRSAGHQNLIPLFKKALAHVDTNQIVDLCSGGSGPWLRLHAQLREAGLPVTLTLTDKFPTPEVLHMWPAACREGVEYLAQPVEATKVPPQLDGMRTLFEGFHHFQPAEAHRILQDALDNRAPIGIFEASLPPRTGWLIFLFSPLMTWLGYLFATPFIKPLTLPRLLFTYLIPIVPLSTIWDGMVSFLRVYSVKELQQLTGALQRPGYTWEIGQVSTGTPLFVYTYLLGYPE